MPEADNNTGRESLSRSGVEVHPDLFAILSVTPQVWERMLQDSSLSPAGVTPYLIFSDPYEITLVLGSEDFEKVRSILGPSRFESGYRLLTFTIAMDLSVVGFLAEVTRILAESSIPVLALSSFSRDHLLIKQADLAEAMRSLGPYVGDLC